MEKNMIRKLNEITSYATLDELPTINHLDVYLRICRNRRDSLAKLSNVPGKAKALKAWDAKIAEAAAKHAKLLSGG